MQPKRSRNHLSKLRNPEWLISGSVAAIMSAAVLTLCGWLENRRPAGPINGPSQWLWGRRAAHRTDFDISHTLPGYVIHHTSSLMWSSVHHALYAPYGRDTPTRTRLLQGLGTAALASFVDYRVVRGRLQPGFEQQLCRTSLLTVYLTFGTALALTTHVLARRSKHAARPVSSSTSRMEGAGT